MRSHLNIIKIGGNIVDDKEALTAFCLDFAAMPGWKILVHGGGKEATRLEKQLRIESEKINGRRVTSADSLEVVTMVYAGLINKRITAMLQNFGCDAIGLTGADGKLITATKRPPVKIEGREQPVDFGFVGDILPKDVNFRFLSDLLTAGRVPVVCSIIYDGHGGLLNCNADSVAAAIAIACAKYYDVSLTYCFEQPGVLAYINNPASIIESITAESFKTLKAEGVISGGMLPKIENALEAVKKGVKSVNIKHAANLLKKTGTTIHPNPHP